MSATGAALQYRREENGDAIVWSIGSNEMDDSDDFGEEESEGFGYRCTFRQLLLENAS